MLAIPWMHLKHPVHPVQQELLGRFLAGKPKRRGLGLAHPAMACAALFYALYFTFRLFQIRLRHASEVRSLRSRSFDLLAKTWRFESNEDGEDFYYGDLQRRLSRGGTSMLLLYDYPRGRPWDQPPGSGDSESAQVMEWVFVPLSAPLRLAVQQWRSSRRLRRIARREQGLDAVVAERASLDCLRPRHFRIALSHWSFKAATALWKPKALLTLYEGHAWERLAWSAAKEVDPSCKTIGYQHTVLLAHQLSLLQPADGSPVTTKPDWVLCLGPKTAQMLQPGHRGSGLIPFGTFRTSIREPAGAGPAPERRTVLVLPEAHAEEMQLLFRTAVKAAEKRPDHRFILRCHPILPAPLRQVSASVGRDPRSLPNVEISLGRSVEEEIARSSVVLYRGSSSVLYAVRQGLKAIYLEDPSLPDLDALGDLREWKERVSGPEELAGCLRRYAARDRTDLEKQWAVASEFVRSYAIPVDDTSVNRLLEAIALRGAG